MVCRHEQMADHYGLRNDSRWVYRTPYLPSTPLNLYTDNIKKLESYCCEFLIHAADNEGLQKGIDEELVTKLAQWCSVPVTYAGGGKHLEDLDTVQRLSNGKVDLTIGSALDIFGGSLVRFDDCINWNAKNGS
jgi:phosphoribosylformimino-5-aminoimidazole carboxamide ribotide isomerase